MNKWLLRIVYAALVLLPIGAIADYTATQGAGSTVFSFLCSSTKICPAMVLIDSSNTEKATSGNPLRVDPVGTTTQPVSAASLPLPAGASTSANQSSQLTQETATASALGTTADAPCTLPASTTACSQIAISKAAANGINSSVPAGTNVIGKVGIDQTTPGTTNGVQVNAALPAGTNTIGNVGADPSSGKGAPSSVPINVSTATTTQLVALSGSTSIYVTSFDVIAGGTGNITFEYGTGSNCGTGTTTLTGAYPLTAQAGIAKGNGNATILKVPSGNALCVLTSAAVQMSGSVSYQQF